MVKVETLRKTQAVSMERRQRKRTRRGHLRRKTQKSDLVRFLD